LSIATVSRFFLLLLLPWLLPPAPAQTPPNPSLEFKEPLIKIETKGKLEKFPATYEFRNTGKKAVTITSITSSCGCTVAGSDKTTYAPGESGTIRLEYTPTGPPGVRYYHVGVVTDEVGGRSYELKLQVNHDPRIAMDKRLLVWEQGESRSAKVIKLTVKADDPIKIKGAEAEKDLFNFSLKDGAVPGEKLLTVTPKMFAGVTGGKTRISLITEPPLASHSEAPIFAILR